MPLHTNTFTHSAFTHRRFYTSVFDDRTSFRAQGLRGTSWNRNFTSVFDDRTSFRAKGFAGQVKSQLLTIDPHFVRKSCAGHRNFTSVFWRSNLVSCERVAPDKLKSQFYLSFWRSNLVSCQRVAPDKLKSQFYLSFWRSNLVSCERVARDKLKSQFYLSFWRIEPRFVWKGCVSCRLVGTAPAPASRREIEKKERARGARGQEGKRRRCEDVRMWRWEDVKMRRCEDEKVWRWEGVKMRRCEDEKMWRCEDDKMWRWEDVKMRRCEDEKMRRCEDVKMRRCEDEKVWRWEGVKMRRWDTDPHYWKNPALKRSREKDRIFPTIFPWYSRYYYYITIILLSYYYHASYSHAIPILFPLLRRILLCERFTPCFTFGAFGTSGPNGRWASQQCPLPAAGPGGFWVKNRVFLYPLVNIQKTMENHHF